MDIISTHDEYTKIFAWWRYIDFVILLIPTPLVSVPFYSSIPTFCSFFIRTKKKNAKSSFFTSHGAYVNCAIIAILYTHSIGNQP